ncbi:hypothetical protein ACTFIW_011099 [Dictyostelium discoideum]
MSKLTQKLFFKKLSYKAIIYIRVKPLTVSHSNNKKQHKTSNNSIIISTSFKEEEIVIKKQPQRPKTRYLNLGLIQNFSVAQFNLGTILIHGCRLNVDRNEKTAFTDLVDNIKSTLDIKRDKF